MTRCTCKTLQKRRCKNPLCAFGCCWVHLQQKYYNNVVNIQRIWIGYRMRKKINLMKELPIELQQKILFYMTQNFYIKKHHYDVIGKIVEKKLDILWVSLGPPYNSIFTIKTMNNMFYYANKYFDTLSEKKIEKLQNHAEKLTRFIMTPLVNWNEENRQCIFSLQEKVIKYLNMTRINLDLYNLGTF